MACHFLQEKEMEHIVDTVIVCIENPSKQPPFGRLHTKAQWFRQTVRLLVRHKAGYPGKSPSRAKRKQIGPNRKIRLVSLGRNWHVNVANTFVGRENSFQRSVTIYSTGHGQMLRVVGSLWEPTGFTSLRFPVDKTPEFGYTGWNWLTRATLSTVVSRVSY
jgi:hypothetical protein